MKTKRLIVSALLLSACSAVAAPMMTPWGEKVTSENCCHGFAAIAAEYLFRDMLGVRRVDYVGKRVFVAPPSDMPLDWCEGAVPLSDDAVAEISWRRGQDGSISLGSKLPDGWNVIEREKSR